MPLLLEFHKGEHTFLIKPDNIPVTEESVLAQYRQGGDPENLGLLYKTHLPLVYGVCLKYLKDREASQDAVMDIYESISQKLLVAEVTHFKSWLYTVTKNHCLMILRKQKPIVSDERIVEFSDPVHLKEDKIALESDLVSLEECISELKEEQKRCVKKFFLEKKCYSIVAEETGLSLKHIKSHIQNGKRNLKICMEAKHVTR